MNHPINELRDNVLQGIKEKQADGFANLFFLCIADYFCLF